MVGTDRRPVPSLVNAVRHDIQRADQILRRSFRDRVGPGDRVTFSFAVLRDDLAVVVVVTIQVVEGNASRLLCGASGE